MDKDLLEQAIINQLEADLEAQEYDSLSCLLQQLISDEKTKRILIGYLSDTAKENWLEGKTTIRY